MGQKDGGRLPLPLFFPMEGEMLMKIGYIRVSTVEQNTIRQETLMEALGVDEIYMDKVSGKNTNRPELQKMLHYVRKGDTVIVESISRFARNTKDLLELVEQLTAKEVEFISQKESIDTSTPCRKIYADNFCRGCRTGTGIYPATPEGRHCRSKEAGKVSWQKKQKSIPMQRESSKDGKRKKSPPLRQCSCWG